MIHFFLTFGKDAHRSPFADALQASGVPYRIFPAQVLLRYRHRLWLLCVGLPTLAWVALRLVVRSLILARPRPDALVVGSHIEAAVACLVRALTLRRRPAIILLGFILTGRQSSLLNALRTAYFRTLFRFVDGVLCHSPEEVADCSERFYGCRARFVYVPYGLHVYGAEQPPSPPPTPYVFSAGRSGRDYRTLFTAFQAMPDIPLHVACDSQKAIEGCPSADNIAVLTRCYDDAYVTELANAACVVIPLGIDNISAGQMVVIQAMSFARPLIVTRTTTIGHYLQHDVDALLVEPNNAEALRTAVRRVMTEPELAARLARNGRESFERRHCMAAFVNNILGAVKEITDDSPPA